ncbi:MAG: type 4a pilus biogenesis protein PilO [Candidatus Yanofskybacteria bacterium]|nr:type 4a pilus biogenesis protein PilO [Candidatus Yanofskybacteria bacterium]
MNRSFLATLIASATCILFFVLVMPQYDSIKLFREELKSRHLLLAERKQVAENIKNLERQLEERQPDIDLMASFMPRNKQIDEIISSTENMAATSGVQLNSITFSAAAPSSDAFEQLSVNVELIGRYLDLFNFLKSAEQSLRIFDIVEMSISSAGRNDGSASGLNIGLKMKAYYLD